MFDIFVKTLQGQPVLTLTIDKAEEMTLYDLKEKIASELDLKTIRKLGLPAGFENIEPQRQMLSYKENYMRDEGKSLQDYELAQSETVYIEDQGFMVPAGMANIVAYSLPLVTLWFLSNTVPDVQKGRPAFHYLIYSTLFETDDYHSSNVLYVEPTWVKAVNWSVFA